jgi:hypothetical protein
LIFLRTMSPDQQRIKAAEQIMLSIPAVDTIASVPPHDHNGRTPVERLISDEE